MSKSLKKLLSLFIFFVVFLLIFTVIPFKNTIHGQRTYTVYIDPGHGGRDPGAIGYSGYYEKNSQFRYCAKAKI